MGTSTQESERDRLRRRNAVESSLRGLLPGLGLDELRILERQAEKMLRFKRDYGELVIETDARDFRDEAAEEHRDALFYLLAEEIRRSDVRADRLRCEAADEIARMQPIEHGLRELRDAEATTPRVLFEFDMSDVDYTELGGEGG